MNDSGPDRGYEILAAIHVVDTSVATLTERVDTLRLEDSKAEAELKFQTARIDKLERLAWVALGVALASAIPDVAALIP